jgi:hypothetical protein
MPENLWTRSEGQQNDKEMVHGVSSMCATQLVAEAVETRSVLRWLSSNL